MKILDWDGRVVGEQFEFNIELSPPILKNFLNAPKFRCFPEAVTMYLYECSRRLTLAQTLLKIKEVVLLLDEWKTHKLNPSSLLNECFPSGFCYEKYLRGSDEEKELIFSCNSFVITVRGEEVFYG